MVWGVEYDNGTVVEYEEISATLEECREKVNTLIENKDAVKTVTSAPRELVYIGAWNNGEILTDWER